MKSFAPLLNSKWSGSMLNTYEIDGKWAEDGTCYTLTVPPQLVDSIVSMQNYVYDLYKEIADREKCIERLTKELDDYKVARGYREDCMPKKVYS